MKKLEKSLIAILLGSTLFVTGVSFAQQNQNQNGNSNRSNNRNGGNANGGMMNDNSMSGNSNMMNSNSMNGNSNMMMNGNSNMMMNSNSGMNSGMMTGSGMIGNVSIEEFMRVNQQAGAAVAAITPTSGQLSKNDQKLMMEVAMGGMRQLEVSRAALPKVTSESARVLAQAEVDEQTAIAAKLREMAAAKNVTLPAAPDSKTTALVSKMNSMAAGMEFDRMYIKASGVDGHKLLDKTMTKVESRATDADMKALAAAAHPNVRLHQQVSQAELDKMSGKGSRGNSSEGGRSNSNTGGGSTSGNNSNSNR